MIDEFTADLCRETLCPETDFHAFAGGEKLNRPSFEVTGAQ